MDLCEPLIYEFLGGIAERCEYSINEFIIGSDCVHDSFGNMVFSLFAMTSGFITGYATKITLRRADRCRERHDTVTSKFRQRRGGAVRSKRATDG